MSTIAFLALGAVLAVVLNITLALVAGLLGAVAAKGGNWPPRNPGARTQFTMLVMLVALVAGFWLAWQIVM